MPLGSHSSNIEAAREAVLALLAARGRDATLCPSEAARALAAAAPTEGWRSAMPAVHAAVDALLAEGRVRLSWKGRALPARTGPYRIADAGLPDPEPLIR